MDNFVFGLQSIALSMYYTLASVLHNQLVWGFALGFFASTFIHILVSTENLSQVPHILTKPKMMAFDKVSPRTEHGAYTMSYTKFNDEYHRIRNLSYAVVLAFLAVVALAMLRFS